MSQIRAQASMVLAAPPEDVYATIADYRQGHPSILPKKSFFNLQVEQGGYGAGTVIRFKVRILGVERSLHHRVSEPEPGKVLAEQDIDSAQHMITTFTVLPLEQGRQSHVEISTTFDASPGLQGLLERLLVPMANARIYRQELKLLEGVAQKKGYMPRTA